MSIRQSLSEVNSLGTPLPRTFYTREPDIVAQALIGKQLVRILQGEMLVGRIVEAEAYRGSGDEASHAYTGPTTRNAPMFGPPGHTYVYFIYGMHWMFNIAAHPPDTPGAVLIRALEPVAGIEVMQQHRRQRRILDLTNGPAKLAQALAIDKGANDIDLCNRSYLTVVPGTLLPGETIAIGPRVRVPGGQDAKTRPWRFQIKDNPWVSR